MAFIGKDVGAHIAASWTLISAAPPDQGLQLTTSLKQLLAAQAAKRLGHLE
jgi:hypothetical protein